MRMTAKRIFAFVSALLFVFCAIPAAGVFADAYDQHDVSKLRTFFEYTCVFGVKNGESVNGSGYDPSDPSTWSKSCVWDVNTGKLKSFTMTEQGSWVTGVLDLDGFTGLETLVIQDCYISGVVLSGCTSLKHLDLSGDRLTEISVSDCAGLENLLARENAFTSIDLSNNAALRFIDLYENKLESLDVSACTELFKLNCQRNSLTGIDLSNNLKLTELELRTNLIASVDISMLTELKVFNSRANRLTSLDLSVMNGGESFILDSEPGGFIGTYFAPTGGGGYSPFVSYSALEGFVFLGWYSDDVFLSSESSLPVVFSDGEKHITARFMLPGDADISGKVEASDALLVLRFAMGLISANGIRPEAADVDKSGSIDASDALLILRFAMGIIDSF